RAAAAASGPASATSRKSTRAAARWNRLEHVPQHCAYYSLLSFLSLSPCRRAMDWNVFHPVPNRSFQANPFVHSNAFSRIGSRLRVAKGRNYGVKIAAETGGIAGMFSALLFTPLFPTCIERGLFNLTTGAD